MKIKEKIILKNHIEEIEEHLLKYVYVSISNHIIFFMF